MFNPGKTGKQFNCAHSWVNLLGACVLMKHLVCEHVLREKLFQLILAHLAQQPLFLVLTKRLVASGNDLKGICWCLLSIQL